MTKKETQKSTGRSVSIEKGDSHESFSREDYRQIIGNENHGRRIVDSEPTYSNKHTDITRPIRSKSDPMCGEKKK